jgi:2-polyprenyl-3-methyl-5-hydroxy-6-metoxy-1,4-benzoquinol methylase
MNNELLNILVCPICQESCELNITKGSPENVIDGYLQCRRCSKKYTIANDVPFFAPMDSHSGIRSQQDTYSTWWDDYHDENSIIDPVHRASFNESLALEEKDLRDKVVLDAGCGNGRFSYVVSQFSPKLLVSFDLSSGLIHAKKAISQHNPQAKVAYVQGDITRPPFKKGSFDVVFSWGVLTHTPNARTSFSTLSTLLKMGGKLGVYVYEFHPLYRYDKQWLSFAAYIRNLFFTEPLRYICSRLPTKIVQWLFIPIYYAERVTGIGIAGCHGFADNKWDKDRYFRVVIDRFKTRYASEHQMEEVLGWFQDNGLDRVKINRYPRISALGTKVASERVTQLEAQFI